MAITFDFAKNFYFSILNSHHGTDAIWVDENGTESAIKIFVDVESKKDSGVSKTFKKSLYTGRNLSIFIANSDIYGRTNIKIRKEKIKFKFNVTDTTAQTFLISNIASADKSKIELKIEE